MQGLTWCLVGGELRGVLQADEEKESSTYSAILAMRNALPGNTYIQYTATPQANILISMQDVLSPKSHTLLTPGKDYIGGEKFFYHIGSIKKTNFRIIR